MILEFLKEPLIVDGKPFMKDLRINVTPQRQARIKTSFIEKVDPETINPVDLVIMNIGTPKLDGMSLNFELGGKELLRTLPFALKLKYLFLKKKWVLTGEFNNKPVKSTCDSFVEIIVCIKNLINNEIKN